MVNIKYGYEEIHEEKIFVVDYITFFDAHKTDESEEVQYVIFRLKEEVMNGRSALLIRSFEDSDQKIIKARYDQLKEVDALEENLKELKKLYR